MEIRQRSGMCLFVSGSNVSGFQLGLLIREQSGQRVCRLLVSQYRELHRK